MHKPVPANGRSDQLDSLRIIAIVGVLFDHIVTLEGFAPGQVSVRFFLLLSGFLITRTLDRYVGPDRSRNARMLRSFYARRSLRIWPLYYAVLAVLLVSGAITLEEMTVGGLFLTNLAQAWHNSWDVPSWFLSHVWTLCVQEQFYLVWPVLFVVLKAAHRLRFLGSMLVIGVLYRAGMWLAGLDRHVAFTTFPLASFDALAIGSLLAVTHARLSRRITGKVQSLALFAALLLSLMGASGGFVGAVLLPTLWLLPLGVLTLSAFDGRLGLPGVVLTWRPLVFLGRISLGVYLLHLPMWLGVFSLSPPWLAARVEHSGWMAFAVVTPLTVLAAVLCWHLYEKPLQRLRKFFAYTPPMQAPQAASFETAPQPAASAPPQDERVGVASATRSRFVMRRA